MFLRGTDCAGGDEAQVEAAPSTLVPKRNPNRSRSSEKRATSDLRRINLYFGNSEIYPAELPTVSDLAKRIVALKRNPSNKCVIGEAGYKIGVSSD